MLNEILELRDSGVPLNKMLQRDDDNGSFILYRVSIWTSCKEEQIKTLICFFAIVGDVNDGDLDLTEGKCSLMIKNSSSHKLNDATDLLFTWSSCYNRKDWMEKSRTTSLTRQKVVLSQLQKRNSSAEFHCYH